MTRIELQKLITNIPDFPVKGIQFKDITPLINNPVAFQTTIDIFADFVKTQKATAILAPEARGFVFGAAIAYKLGIKLVLARKKGKLPAKTYEVQYKLEYGNASLQINCHDLTAADKVVVIDDLIATAGTINACLNLIAQSKAKVVGIATLIKLTAFVDKHDFKDIPFLEIIKF